MALLNGIRTFLRRVFFRREIRCDGGISNSSGPLTINPTTYTRIGDAGSPVHVTGSDGLYASDSLEVKNTSYFGSHTHLEDDKYHFFGTSDDARFGWNLNQTVHSLYFGLKTGQNLLIVGEAGDYTTNFGNPQQSNPTTIWQNADKNSIYGRGYICHDDDDFTLQSHRGGFSFEVPAQYAQGTLTLTGPPVNNETFVVNATTCTAKTSGAGADEFDIGSTEAETVTNIVAMIAAGTEAANVKAWDGAGDTVVFEWLTAGVAGHAITVTTALTNTTIDGSGTLGGTHAGVAAKTPIVIKENGIFDVDGPNGGSVSNHGTPVELADDASFDLPDASTGFGFFHVGDGEEIAQISWDSAANVTLIYNSLNVVSTDTDTKFCIFDNGTAVRVRNRLGSAKKVMFDYHYTTP